MIYFQIRSLVRNIQIAGPIPRLRLLNWSNSGHPVRGHLYQSSVFPLPVDILGHFPREVPNVPNRLRTRTVPGLHTLQAMRNYWQSRIDALVVISPILEVRPWGKGPQLTVPRLCGAILAIS